MSDETLNSGGSGGSESASISSSDVSGGGESASPSTPTASRDLDSAFDDAIASLEGSAPVSAETAEAPPPVQATSAQPEQPQAETPPPPSPGEPPQERWPTILENARAKERESVLQHVVSQYGDALRVVESLRSDPVGTVTQLISELQADPRFAQQMASHAARTLRAARQAAPDPASEEPQPDLDAGNGVYLYSAQQQAKREAWLRSQWQQEMQTALQPVVQDLEQRRHQDKLTAAQKEAVQQTQARLSKWADRPHFKEHKEAIRTKQAEYFKAGYETWDALSMAYADVLEHTVLPARAQQQQQQTVAMAAQKLRAATPNPSATAAAAPRKAKNLDDAFEMALGQIGAA